MDVVSQTRRVKVIKDNAIVCEKTRLNSYMLLAEKEVCDTLKLSLMIITQEEKKEFSTWSYVVIGDPHKNDSHVTRITDNITSFLASID